MKTTYLFLVLLLVSMFNPYTLSAKGLLETQILLTEETRKNLEFNEAFGKAYEDRAKGGDMAYAILLAALRNWEFSGWEGKSGESTSWKDSKGRSLGLACSVESLDEHNNEYVLKLCHDEIGPNFVSGWFFHSPVISGTRVVCCVCRTGK